MNELLKKIKAIQSKLSVKKDGKNPFYESRYVTLDNIMDKLQPLLDEQGLMIYNYNTDGGVKTIVTDFNENVYSEFKIQGVTDPQAMGKVITYGRRYNLVSIFNILADEDDDAQSYYDNKGKTKKPKFTEADLERFKKKKAGEFKNYQEAKAYIEQYFTWNKDLYGKVMDLYSSPEDETADLLF